MQKFLGFLRGWGGKSFWIRRIILARVIPVTILALLTMNPYARWLEAGMTSSLCIPGGDMRGQLPLLVVTLAAVVGWGYVLHTCWLGVGAKWYKAGALIALISAAFILAMNRDLIPTSEVGFRYALQLVIGVALGLGFSLPLINRQLSGVGTTFVESSHEYNDSGHHHM